MNSTVDAHVPHLQPSSASTATYDVLHAFADQLAAHKVTDVVVSPGSRSTPIALTFHAHPLFNIWVMLDERSAGFFALGLSRATGLPSVLVCTSGTAAANYLPSVVEAYHAGVPLIMCTADRPPEMRGWGSPQTIKQANLYGDHVKLARDMPVLPGQLTTREAAICADYAVTTSTHLSPGPVHLNWPIQEPLEPPHDFATAACVHTPNIHYVTQPPPHAHSHQTYITSHNHHRTHTHTKPTTAHVASDIDGDFQASITHLNQIIHKYRRGVIIAGPWPAGGLHKEIQWARDTLRLAAWSRWPVIGEPLTGVRDRTLQATYVAGQKVTERSHVVVTADHLLACQSVGDAVKPDVVLLVGRVATSKSVRLWVERTHPTHVIQVDPENRWQDAVFRITGHVPASIDKVCEALIDSTNLADTHKAASTQTLNNFECDHWIQTWRSYDNAARRVVDETITPASTHTLTPALAPEPAQAPVLTSASTIRAVVGSLPANSILMSSNSMPIRDLDAYVYHTNSVQYTGNRGASGIDGVVSTALGLAASNKQRPVVLHIGDIALMHDLSSLTSAARLGLHLTVVCVDNNGGGIFSLLPISDRIDTDAFTQLFRTPHNVCFQSLNGFGGIRTHTPITPHKLALSVLDATSTRCVGVDMIIVKVKPGNDTAQRSAIRRSIPNVVIQ